jgi:hypothetical protein
MPPDQDDRSINDDAGLLRRVHPNWVVADGNTGGRRVSSAAFRDPALSVDIEPILVAQGLDWQFTLKAHAGYSLVRFPAGSAREKGLSVVSKPLPGNPAHAEVLGKKTARLQNI